LDYRALDWRELRGWKEVGLSCARSARYLNFSSWLSAKSPYVGVLESGYLDFFSVRFIEDSPARHKICGNARVVWQVFDEDGLKLKIGYRILDV